MTTLTKDLQLRFVKGSSKLVTECHVVPGQPFNPGICYYSNQLVTYTVWTIVVYDEYGTVMDILSSVSMYPPPVAGVPSNWTVQYLAEGYIEVVESIVQCTTPQLPTPDQTVCETYTKTVPDHYAVDTQGQWNSGAYSIGTLVGDGYLEYSVPVTSHGSLAGFAFNARENDQIDPRHVKFGFVFMNGTYRRVVWGSPTGAFVSYNANDRFQLRRYEGTMYWYRNETEVGSLALNSTNASRKLVGQAALFLAGDQIVNAVLANVNELNGDAEFASTATVLDAGINPGAAGDPVAAVIAGDAEFGGYLTINDQDASGLIATPNAEFIPSISMRNGVTITPTVNFGGFLRTTATAATQIVGIPEFAGDGQLGADAPFVDTPNSINVEAGMRGYGWIIPGNVITATASNAAPYALLMDDNYTLGNQVKFAARGKILATSDTPGGAVAEIPFPAPKVEGGFKNAAQTTTEIPVPMPVVEGSFYAGPSRVPVPMPFAEGSFERGRTLWGDVPMLMPLVESFLPVGFYISADVPFPVPVVEGDFGFTGSLIFPAPIVEGVILPGRSILSSVPVPMPFAEGVVYTGGVILTGDVPFWMPNGEGLDTVFGSILVPMPFSEGSFVVTASDSSYAYAINLRTGAAARWTSYPAIGRIVRWQNRHFAIIGTDIVEITGSLDDTAEIDSLFETAPIAFDDLGIKRPVAVYASAREDNGAYFYLVVDENKKSKIYYAKPGQRGYGTHNLRAATGRGLRAFSRAAIGAQNKDGGALDIHTLELMLDPTSRKV